MERLVSQTSPTVRRPSPITAAQRGAFKMVTAALRRRVTPPVQWQKAHPEKGPASSSGHQAFIRSEYSSRGDCEIPASWQG